MAKKLCGDSGQLTAKGKPCGNPVQKGSDKCGAHGGKSGRPPITPSSIAVAATDDTPAQTYGKAIAALVRLGMRQGPAAARLAIHHSTVASWVERGEADAEAGKETEFSEFVREMTVAQSAFLSDMLQQVHRAAKGTPDKQGDWRAAMALLERLRPEDFSLKHQVEHSGQINLAEQHTDQMVFVIGAILAELELTDEQLARVPDLIEKHLKDAEQQEA